MATYEVRCALQLAADCRQRGDDATNHLIVALVGCRNTGCTNIDCFWRLCEDEGILLTEDEKIAFLAQCDGSDGR